MLLVVTAFQLLSFAPVTFADGETKIKHVYTFGSYIVAEWLYIAVAGAVAKATTSTR